jgi:hydroxymethylbilane synthase
VGTRLGKLAGGEADATLLAKAGLDRLKMTDCITDALEPEVMLPAAAQGAVGIEARLDDTALLDALHQINHGDTSITVKAERALLAALDGSCRTPIGAYAVLGDAGDITLQALLASEDGSKTWRTERHGLVGDADRLGADAGAELRAAGDAHLFED